jgi:uncharacterized protein YdaU (DUF1376 family)
MPNELHTMPLKLERLFSSLSFRGMKWDERGAYLLLLCEAWLKQGYMPAKAELQRAALNGISDEDFTRIKAMVIDAMFKPDGAGNIYNESQIEIYNEVLMRLNKLKENGRKGGLSKAKAWLKQGHSRPAKQGSSNQNQNQNQTLNKEKAKGLIIPDSLRNDAGFMESWIKWIAFRKKKKAPNDWDMMFQAQLDDFEKLGADEAIKRIQQSIRNGWQGLFEIKDKTFNKKDEGLAIGQKHAQEGLPAWKTP